MDLSDREELERLCGGLSDLEYYWLENEEYIREYDQNTGALSYLADKVRELRAGQQSRPADVRERTAPLIPERAWVVSLLVAAEAAKEDVVKDFRSRVLRGRLIAFEKIAAWVKRNAGPEIEGSLRHLLTWSTPGTDSVSRSRVAPTSPAGELHAVTERLAPFYGWQPAQAAAFVLCDAVPICSPLRVHHIERGPVRSTSRIILEIDPTVPPADVESAYREARKAFGRQRFRAVSERDLHLVAFSMERPALEGPALLREWSNAYPQWTFRNAEYLVTVLRKKRDKLLDPFE